MSRELPDWIDAYIEYTQHSEPPTSYHLWCGLSLIAGALQRKASLEWGFEKIYPNLYVVLVGPAGRTRKGVALGIAKELLSSLTTVSIAPESTSGREAIIVAMRRALTNFTDVNGAIRFHCSLTAFSEELSVLLGQSDIKLLANLTDWYDSKSDWTYETIGRGRDSLQGLCFNIMGGTAPDWIQSMLPQEAIGGGFTSRVIFIVEENKGKTVAEHNMTKRELDLRIVLQRDLERINQLCGDFQFTPEGKTAYITWYEQQDALLAKGKQAVSDTRFSSYCERRATHMRKLMMLFSVSRGSSLELGLPDFNRALQTLEAAEVKMSKTFGGLGKGRYSDVTERIMEYIKGVGTTTRSTLLSRFYRDVDAQSMASIEAMLDAMKVIKITLISSGEKTYKWIGKKDPPN